MYISVCIKLLHVVYAPLPHALSSFKSRCDHTLLYVPSNIGTFIHMNSIITFLKTYTEEILHARGIVAPKQTNNDEECGTQIKQQDFKSTNVVSTRDGTWWVRK